MYRKRNSESNEVYLFKHQRYQFEFFLRNFIKNRYNKSIRVAITIIIAFSINVASVMGSLSAVPKQAH